MTTIDGDSSVWTLTGEILPEKHSSRVIYRQDRSSFTKLAHSLVTSGETEASCVTNRIKCNAGELIRQFKCDKKDYGNHGEYEDRIILDQKNHISSKKNGSRLNETGMICVELILLLKN